MSLVVELDRLFRQFNHSIISTFTPGRMSSLRIYHDAPKYFILKSLKGFGIGFFGSNLNVGSAHRLQPVEGRKRRPRS